MTMVMVWLTGSHIVQTALSMLHPDRQLTCWASIVSGYLEHYIDTTWTSWQLKSMTTALFGQLFVQISINENFKAPHYQPFVGESSSDRRMLGEPLVASGFHSKIGSYMENVTLSWHYQVFAILYKQKYNCSWRTGWIWMWNTKLDKSG